MVFYVDDDLLVDVLGVEVTETTTGGRRLAVPSHDGTQELELWLDPEAGWIGIRLREAGETSVHLDREGVTHLRIEWREKEAWVHAQIEAPGMVGTLQVVVGRRVRMIDELSRVALP